MKNEVSDYSETEEKLNIFSHALGAVLSIIGLVLFVVKAFDGQTSLEIFSNILFASSLITLYLASTLYHSAIDPIKRARKKIFDHCAIYVLIAGTYTPYVLIALKGSLGWTMFCIVWTLALIGVSLKLFFTGRFKIFSTSMYVLMGWLIAFFFKPLSLVLAPEGIDLLLAGGISYTVGAIIYSIKVIKFNHAIFHIFVLCGSLCHFLSIYLYL